MYCPECGSQNRDGLMFCNNCGSRIGQPQPGAARPQAVPVVQPVQQPGTGQTKGAFSSPAVIALVVILGLLLIGGITVGIVLIVKSSGPSAEEKLAEVWADYEGIAAEAYDVQAKVALDTNALNSAKEDLEAAQKQAKKLQDALAETKVSRQEPRDVQLEKIIGLYDDYAGALGKLYATLAGAVANQAVAANQASIDAQKQAIKDLLAELNDATDDFLAENNAVKGKQAFNPKVASDAIDDLAEEIAKAATAEAEAAAARPYNEAAGIYISSDGSSITLHADKTVDAIHADKTTSSGTYALSGTTITFVSEGRTDVGTLVNSVITAPDGRQWVLQPGDAPPR